MKEWSHFKWFLIFFRSARLYCTYHGERYLAGRNFPASDGCNECTCRMDATYTCTSSPCHRRQDRRDGSPTSGKYSHFTRGWTNLDWTNCTNVHHSSHIVHDYRDAWPNIENMRFHACATFHVEPGSLHQWSRVHVKLIFKQNFTHIRGVPQIYFNIFFINIY